MKAHAIATILWNNTDTTHATLGSLFQCLYQRLARYSRKDLEEALREVKVSYMEVL